MEDELDSRIREYFSAGFSLTETLTFLEVKQNIILSYRQLKRHCKRLGLKKRPNWDPAVVQAAILVLQYQNIIDPEGVQARLSNRLSRREYFNRGPNFLIHIDGYDKIKKYGFGIHGAICGFSRRILWLKVAHSNNNPNIIAAYFLEFVKEIRGTFDYKFPVDEADCECLGAYCDVPSSTGIEEELDARFLQMMQLDGMLMPETSAEAIDLLIWLISKLD